RVLARVQHQERMGPPGGILAAPSPAARLARSPVAQHLRSDVPDHPLTERLVEALQALESEGDEAIPREGEVHGPVVPGRPLSVADLIDHLVEPGPSETGVVDPQQHEAGEFQGAVSLEHDPLHIVARNLARHDPSSSRSYDSACWTQCPACSGVKSAT